MQEPLYTVRSKLPNVGTTIFTVMSDLATKHNAINLSQGFPDFSCDKHLANLVTHYIDAGKNQYAPMTGVAALREAIVNKTFDLYGADYDAELEITVTAGATQAIYTAIAAVVHPGDEVIIFEPAYDSYTPAVEMHGGKVVPIALDGPYYTIDWREVAQRITSKTRLIIINTPNNPSTTVFSESDMRALERLIEDKEIYILSDEVYEHIVFDSNKHQSITRFPRLAERAFIVSSFGKTYHVTGWKIGYCLAPHYLMKEFRKIHQYMVFCCNAPLQYAFADLLSDKERYLGLASFYQQKRDFFVRAMRNSRFIPLSCSGTYFQLFNYANISDAPDTNFARTLVEKYGVAAIPTSIFYHTHRDNKTLRFCFAKSEDTLMRAAELLCAV